MTENISSEERQKIYMSGQTDSATSEKQFARAEQWLRLKDLKAVNSLAVKKTLCIAFTENEYASICLRMIDLCDGIYMLKGWQNSMQARFELSYAKAIGKRIKFEDKQWKFRQTLPEIFE